mmetsp:Transcript_29692/g.69100  ORF Transcript_29692/g.69100 Transcript_29692/m.69100 type:complete len:200 (-) Transcript_29692:371-970(-)
MHDATSGCLNTEGAVLRYRLPVVLVEINLKHTKALCHWQHRRCGSSHRCFPVQCVLQQLDLRQVQPECLSRSGHCSDVWALYQGYVLAAASWHYEAAFLQQAFSSVWNEVDGSFPKQHCTESLSHQDVGFCGMWEVVHSDLGGQVRKNGDVAVGEPVLVSFNRLVRQGCQGRVCFDCNDVLRTEHRCLNRKKPAAGSNI